MRIAVRLRDRCKSKRCARECIKYCPRVRAGDETIVMGEESKPVISEELCVGCGICINDLSEISNAIKAILADEDGFKRRSKASFSAFSFDNNYAKLIEAIKAATSE